MLKLGGLGAKIKAAITNLSDEQKKDRDAVFKAMGDSIEAHLEALLRQLTITVPPLPGLGSSLSGVGGGPTLPGPAPVVIPAGSLK